MKKVFIVLIITLSIITSSVMAGGLQTNTNRSVAYLRYVARGTSFAPDAVYFNPAGTAFMEDGWHIDFSVQQVFQKRTIESTFAPFAQNEAYLGESTRTYIGNTFAPFVPNIHAIWKKNKWAVMASLEVGGGGGSVEFNNGLGSFESMICTLPNILTNMGLSTSMYSMDMYLKATSIRGTGTIGAAYKVLPCLSISLQANMNYAIASYKGELANIEVNSKHPVLNPTGAMINASNMFTAMGLPEYASLVSDRRLDASQNGFSISPIIAVCFNKNGWTANVKYEFKSALSMKNHTKEDIVIGGTGMFPDGEKEANDIPAMLSIAAGYDFGKARVSAQWNHYFDKQANNSFSDVVQGASNEYLIGFEYDITKKILLSCGLQRSVFNLDLKNYSDQNYYLNSTSVGFGGAYKICKFVSLEAGCFLSFYNPRERNQEVYNGNTLNLPGKDVFKRSSISYGIGAIFNF